MTRWIATRPNMEMETEPEMTNPQPLIDTVLEMDNYDELKELNQAVVARMRMLDEMDEMEQSTAVTAKPLAAYVIGPATDGRVSPRDCS
jgi:aspartokinase-like uncharacterized kinase